MLQPRLLPEGSGIASLRLGTRLLAGTAAASLLISLAHAQQAASGGANSDQLEEIVVKARYQSENVQATPLAITALTGDQMEQRGFNNSVDIGTTAPNVTVTEAQGGYGKSVFAYIRGIGQFNPIQTLEPGVGFYIDDVYFATVTGAIFELTDIDHVEVERGPQGTLNGKNSEGGAIKLYSTLPKGDDSGYAQVGYGSFNREKFNGAFDVAIVPDKLFMRVSGGSNTADGYVDVLDFACLHPKEAGALKATTTAAGCKVGDEGNEDVQGGRLELRALPADGLEINLEADVTDDRSNAAPQKLLYVDTTGKYQAGLATLNAALEKEGLPPLDDRFITGSPWTNYATFMDPQTGQSVIPQNADFDFGYSARIDWDALPGLHVKSITAYRGYDAKWSEDDSISPVNFDLLSYDQSHHQFSQEVDLTGQTTLLDRGLDWAGGVYYLHDSGFLYTPVSLDYYGFSQTGMEPEKDDNESFFLHGNYHITDELAFEAGYRYTNEWKAYSFTDILDFVGLNTGLPIDLSALHIFNIPTTTRVISYARSDARVGLTYQWTPDLMTYVSLATGFRAGGINPTPANAAQVTGFGPEDLITYELGFKSEWLDHRVRVNGAAFLSDYKDLQSQTIEDQGGVLQLSFSNIGHVLIEGGELEVDAQPLPGLLFNGTTGYIEYNTLSLGNSPPYPSGPLEGYKPMLVPKWTVALGGQYTYDFDELGSLTGRLDWKYQSTVFNEQTNNPLMSQAGYGLLNGHVTYGSPDGLWQVTMQVTNITDQVYYVNHTPLLRIFGVVPGTPGRPREFLLSLRRDFAPSASAPAAYTPPPTPAPVPAAPAPQAAAPEVQRTFQVFFDFDKSDITEAAGAVIQAAAEAIRQGHVVRIQVTGHTDTVGSAKYNQALSERRAAAVKARLVADGVEAGEIATGGVGKSGLLVPTADGVREPQNRRAEILLQ